MSLRELLKKHGLTQAALSRRFGIPLRTIENWCGGLREPPVYLIKMMDELLSK